MLILLLILALASILLITFSLKLGITPMPTNRHVKKIILETLPPLSQKQIVELGAGWGTLACPLAKRYPTCTILAYELSPVPYLVLYLRSLFLPNLYAIRKDFFTISLAQASLIMCYLYRGAMVKLAPKLRAELPDHALIVSHTFALPHWKAEKSLKANDVFRSPIFFYYRHLA